MCVRAFVCRVGGGWDELALWVSVGEEWGGGQALLAARPCMVVWPAMPGANVIANNSSHCPCKSYLLRADAITLATEQQTQLAPAGRRRFGGALAGRRMQHSLWDREAKTRWRVAQWPA